MFYCHAVMIAFGSWSTLMTLYAISEFPERLNNIMLIALLSSIDWALVALSAT